MEGVTIFEMVENFGFPVAVCIALFLNNRETNKQYKNALDSLNKTVHENTVAITRLLERIK